MEIENWNYKDMPDKYHDVLCWCTGDGKNYHKRVMYLREVGEDTEWSENYDVMCWVDVPIVT